MWYCQVNLKNNNNKKKFTSVWKLDASCQSRILWFLHIYTWLPYQGVSLWVSPSNGWISWKRFFFFWMNSLGRGCAAYSSWTDISHENLWGYGVNVWMCDDTSQTIMTWVLVTWATYMHNDQDAILASMLLRAAPVRAFRGARFVGGADADRVPRIYIKTMHDRVLKPEQQDALIKRWPPCKVFVLESDHSPFFSTPSALFAFLLEAAASVNCI
jgi:hypothetical protein